MAAYGLKYGSAWSTGKSMRTSFGKVTTPLLWKNFWFRGYTANSNPVVTSITPDSGASTEETQVTIAGSNFGTTRGEGFVFCKNTRAASYVSWSDTAIVCKLGFHPTFDGLSTLYVTRDTGQIGSLANAFNAIANPYITGINQIVSIYGGNTVTVYGSNFLASGTITFAGTSAESIISWSDSVIVCISPGHLTAGLINVVVTNSISQAATVVITASNSTNYIARYFLDPAASGTANGFYWGDAFTTLQAALDATSAGKTIYARGTETVTTEIVNTTNNGVAGSFCKLIGCNSSGVDDGTYYTLAANLANTGNDAILKMCPSYWMFKNIEFTNSNTEPYAFRSTNYVNGTIFIHCKALGKYFYGLLNSPIYLRCSIGYIEYGNGPSIFFCNIGNALTNIVGDTLVIGSIIKTFVPYNMTTGVQILMNVVIDASASYGYYVAGALTYMSGVRITNCSTYGRLSYSATNIYLCCFLNNNTSGNFQYPNNPGDVKISILETGTQGYVDRANGNYNLTNEASNRNIAIQIGCSSVYNINVNHLTAGLNPSLKPAFNQKSRLTKYVGIWSPRG